MNSFETMGNAILLANEGETQLGYLVMDWLVGLVTSFRKPSAAKPTSITRA